MKIEQLVALDDVPDGLSRITLPEGQFLTFVGRTGVALARIPPGAGTEPGDGPEIVRFEGLVHKPTP